LKPKNLWGIIVYLPLHPFKRSTLPTLFIYPPVDTYLSFLAPLPIANFLAIMAMFFSKGAILWG